jgi:hypothetical protein
MKHPDQTHVAQPPSAVRRTVRTLLLAGLLLGGTCTAQRLDCTKFESPGCASFNEMLAAKDADLISEISPPNRSFVCLRKAEDTFIVVSFKPPEASDFLKTASGSYAASGRVRYSRFEKGILSRYKRVFGEWFKYSNDQADPPTFTSRTLPKLNVAESADIDNSEVNVSYSYKNVSNEDVFYSLTIRISTRRFNESFSSKGALPIENAGYCAEFK